MKILVIQQKMIGDVLTSSILFRALKERFPHAELHYLIQPHTLPVVENNPYIDHLVLFDPEKQKSISDLLRFSKGIKKESFEVVIDVYSKINSAIITGISGAQKRISFRKWYTQIAYTHTFLHKEKLDTNAGYAIEDRMLLLRAIAPDFPVEMKPKIYLTNSETREAKVYLSREGIREDLPLLMISILGSSHEKTYPLKYMAELLDFISSETSAQLLFNYIPKQEEQARKLLQMCTPSTQEKIFFQVFGKGLREFLAITSHCNALIGNEGGAVNMAKALNIPSFSIFSPQIKKENWSIYEDGSKNISVHLKDYSPQVFKGLSKGDLTKKSEDLYELLKPNLIFAKLSIFLQKNIASFRESQNKIQ